MVASSRHIKRNGELNEWSAWYVNCISVRLLIFVCSNKEKWGRHVIRRRKN